MNEKGPIDDSSPLGYREFKRGKTVLEFSMSFPRGYGTQKKVKAWIDEFQKLPYISPYEDSRGIDPNSDLMEKRVVGVLHEFLSLTALPLTEVPDNNSGIKRGVPSWETGSIYRSKGVDILSQLDNVVDEEETETDCKAMELVMQRQVVMKTSIP
ncbi:hypothetical protein HAX54_030954 [Datura stramonium]|uniref:PORR domain-containing protein n=1 Tax=Datura stramonium TaxID=4076 RepID=A0ABS8SBL2_DATST|nr:hypothetical protein [Datura stramonium]